MKTKKELLKADDDGLCQIAVRYDVTRTNRPRLKTGIFIHPDLWDESTESIKFPKKGRYSMSRFEEAKEAEERLQQFCSYVSKLVRVGINNVAIDREWLCHGMKLISLGYLTKIESYTDILSAEEKMKKETVCSLPPTEKADLVRSYNSTIIYDMILPYCDRHNLAASRVRVYKVLGRQLHRFELYVQGKYKPRFRLDFNKMTNDDIEDFRSYLRNEHKYVKANPTLYKKIFEIAPQTESRKFKKVKVEERSSNYIAGMMKKLASIFHWLQDTGRTENDPFKGFKNNSVIYGKPIYIKKEERDQIASYDLSSENLILQQQRDIFVFQCLVGCRVGDMLKFTKKNICGDVLEYVPSKTQRDKEQIKVRVPLSATALNLVAKYSGIDKKGRLFPFICAQNYNVRIKQIFSICGINRIVQVRNPKTGKYEARPINEIASSHMARRTFCGIGYKLTKDPNIIGKMSGHVEGSKAFARYRDIDDEDMRGVINMM